MTAIFFIVALVLLVLGAPIAICVGLSSALFLFLADIPSQTVVQRLYMGVTSAPLLAIPFFILAGDLMNRGGLAARMVRLASLLVGRLTGGLAIVTIVGCMFFAAVSGSGIATAAAIGSIMIPAMAQRGYDRAFASAVVGAASPLGIIIPPSISMIIYASIAGCSVTDLYKVGIPAGIIVGLALIVAAYWMSVKKRYLGAEKATTGRELWDAFKGAIWALGTPIIIVGGVFGGIFTPTESAVVAVVYGLVVGLFVYREVKIRDLPAIFSDSMRTTARLMIIISCAALFAWVLSYQRIPEAIIKGMMSISNSYLIAMLLVNIVLLIAGCFIECGALTIIATPLLLPIAMQYGINVVHMGIILIVNTSIGLFTPPFGACLFTAASVGKVSIEDIVRKMGPFLIASLVALLIITYIPISVMFPMSW